MSRVQEVGDNINYTADDGVGFDGEGYLLEPGTDGNRNVQKAQPAPDSGISDNAFVGVTHKSTYNYDETEVLTGQPVGVIQDGVALVLAAGDYDYAQGESLHFPDFEEEAGVASTTNADNTEVGSVVEGYNATDVTGPVLLKVRVDGRV